MTRVIMSMKFSLVLVVLLHVSGFNDASKTIPVTLKSQHMSHIGRQEWITNNTVVQWDSAETALVVVDMWNNHWCASATTRVGELAMPMQQFVSVARALGVTIIWAPSDVTSFYPPSNCTARKNTLDLPNATLPPMNPIPIPTFPLDTSTDGGCDVPCKEYTAWYRQISTLVIEPTDFLIAADLPHNVDAGTQELWNIVSSHNIKNLAYMGVHENMCIMNRPFAIEKMRALGLTSDRVAVVRELVDVMYTPKDPPYVPHAVGLQLHTEFVEKFFGSSISMYDFLAHTYM